jgi:hypothetical protein
MKGPGGDLLVDGCISDCTPLAGEAGGHWPLLASLHRDQFTPAVLAGVAAQGCIALPAWRGRGEG